MISRIGNEHSLERYLADLVFKKIIKKAINEPKKNYKIIRIDREGVGGNLIKAIVDNILKADLVITDLTGLNANVMYELGISHAWNLPVILIALKEQHLPLDIADLDTVFYDIPTNNVVCKKAITEIQKRLSSILKKKQKNPSFELALSIIGKSYSMDGVYDAFASAINDMYKSLDACKHDLESRDVWDNPLTVKSLAQGLRVTFQTIADKIHPFREIVKGPDVIHEPSDKYLLSLLEEADQFRNNAVEIDVLFEGSKTAVKRCQISSKIKVVMSKIKQIAEKLKQRKD